MRISAKEARDHFSEVVNRASFGKERVVVTKNGKPVVAVIPIEDLELLEQARKSRLQAAMQRTADRDAETFKRLAE